MAKQKKQAGITVDALAESIKAIFTDAEDVKVSVRDGKLYMEITAMYEAPGKSLPQLIQLSEVLGTTEIEEYDQINWRGCDTCDHGSKYGVTLEAPNVIGVR